MSDFAKKDASPKKGSPVKEKKEETPAKEVEPTEEEQGEDDKADLNYESTAVFEPVIKLEEVEVKTHEEEEDILFNEKSKLFLFGELLLDKGTGNRGWKERGVGQIKILQHQEHKRVRVLMRQEKTMKILVNHMIDPRIVLTPNSGSDKSWVWSAYDFADGELEEKIFCARFANPDIAKSFKTMFEEQQGAMKKILEEQAKKDKQADVETSDLTDAISSIKVKEEEA